MHKQKTILIISEYFAPNNEIAAIRPTKIAKFLRLCTDYEIIVISKKTGKEDKIDITAEKDLIYPHKHYYISPGRFFIFLDRTIQIILARMQKVLSLVHSSAGEYASNINKFIIEYLFLTYNKQYARTAIELLKKSSIENIDFVFSTYGPYSSHLIGNYLKKNNSHLIWLADFRDQVIALTDQKPLRKYGKTYLSNVVNNADIITAVSEGVLNSILPLQRNAVITNGFDYDDIKDIRSRGLNTKFNLVYCGNLYSGTSDLSFVWRAIAELIEESKIDIEDLCIVYAGSSYEIMRKQTAAYGLDGIIVNYGYITRREALELQMSSQVLLLASWNRSNSTGIVTGKFYEQMMMNKPILCCMTGNLPNSILKEMINKSKRGICCEEAMLEQDFPIFKNYILNLYLQFLNDGKTSVKADQNYIEKFNYRNITKQIIDLIEE